MLSAISPNQDITYSQRQLSQKGNLKPVNQGSILGISSHFSRLGIDEFYRLVIDTDA